jgi:hypothetical protein
MAAFALVLTGGALGLSGCSSPSSNPNAPSTSTSTTAAPITSSVVTISGKKVTVPTDQPGYPISPYQTKGVNIIITSSGVLPRTLYATPTKPVRFTNLTSNTVNVVVNITKNTKPFPIAPGASYTYTPKGALQFTFTTTTHKSGIVIYTTI